MFPGQNRGLIARNQAERDFDLDAPFFSEPALASMKFLTALTTTSLNV